MTYPYAFTFQVLRFQVWAASCCSLTFLILFQPSILNQIIMDYVICLLNMLIILSPLLGCQYLLNKPFLENISFYQHMLISHNMFHHDIFIHVQYIMYNRYMYIYLTFLGPLLLSTDPISLFMIFLFCFILWAFVSCSLVVVCKVHLISLKKQTNKQKIGS